MPDTTFGVDKGGDDSGCDVLEVELVAREGQESVHDDVEDVLAHRRPLVALNVNIIITLSCLFVMLRTYAIFLLLFLSTFEMSQR